LLGWGSVLTEVEEELDENVQSELVVACEVLEVETPNDEEDCEDDETSKLNGLASNGINKRYSGPVTRDCSSSDENTVSGSKVVENLVDGWTGTVPDGSENGSTVQSETIESNIKEEP